MDRYTKIVLTTIAIALVVIGCKTVVQPNKVSAAGNDLMVLCSSCTYEGLPRDQGHLVLLDRNSGNVWIYTDAAMEGKVPPVKWGQLTIGNTLTRYK